MRLDSWMHDSVYIIYFSTENDANTLTEVFFLYAKRRRAFFMK